MRLWTIHPRYLDAKGLVAAWREALLAQKVLAGKTKGYRRHPQLIRFQAQSHPVSAVGAFLREIAVEALRRNYRFDTSRISNPQFSGKIVETEGQLLYEWRHVKRKLRARSPEFYLKVRSIARPDPHPLFKIVPGAVRKWEKKIVLRRTAPRAGLHQA